MGSHTKFAAVVLAAGKGTRMRSRIPKVLHRVCGREMVAHAVHAAESAAIDHIVVVVPQEAQPIRNALGDAVQYAVQSEQLGTGHALMQARSALSGAQHILVMYGDVPLVLPETLARLMQRHRDANACATILTSSVVDPDGKGRIVRNAAGSIVGIVEQADADPDTLAIDEINCGMYCFRAEWLWSHLQALPPSSSGEIYLTDLIEVAAREPSSVAWVTSDDPHETMGVNDRIQLSEAEAVMRQRIRERWMLDGVTMPHPESVYIDHAATLGQDTTVLPNTHISGATLIGKNCRIGPNTLVEDSHIGDGCEVMSSVVRGSTLEMGVDVGPFSHIRDGARIESGVHIGTSAEVKNSRIGRHSKMGHFSYMGDATLGANVNIGAGAVTCNYDGIAKHETHIGDGAFIGCDTMLIAPISVGAGAITGAGAVLTKDVPRNARVAGVPAKPLPSKQDTLPGA